MEKILIVTGEHSGEKYGAEIVNNLNKMCDVKLGYFGSGGDGMKNAGVEILEKVENLSAIGPVEALKLIKNYLTLRKKIKVKVKNEKIKTALLIDFPDFNFFIAPFLKKKGVKIIYFISPTIWIWRYKRIKKIKKYVDIMLSIFPNEQKIFEREGVKSFFVGHPLKKKVETAKKLNLNEIFSQNENKIPIAILPGSRKKEIEHIFSEIIKGLKRIKEKHPEVFFVIPIANKAVENVIKEKIKNLYNFEIFTTHMEASSVLKSSQMAIVKSGTSTLEATFSGIPFFVVYKTSLLTYLIGKTILSIKNIGMVNLIAGENIVPELIQKECNPQKIFLTFEKIYGDEKNYLKIKEKLKKVSDLFGQKETFSEVANIICNEIKTSNPSGA